MIDRHSVFTRFSQLPAHKFKGKGIVNSSNRWTLTVEQDEFSKDFYIILPDELLEKMEWDVGDTLKLDIVQIGIDKSIQITRKEKNA